jgi:hypothetical protein
MYHNLRVDTWYFFVTLGEDITKFFKKECIGDYFVRGTQISNMDIFDDSRFNGYVKGNSGRDIA